MLCVNQVIKSIGPELKCVLLTYSQEMVCSCAAPHLVERRSGQPAAGHGDRGHRCAPGVRWQHARAGRVSAPATRGRPCAQGLQMDRNRRQRAGLFTAYVLFAPTQRHTQSLFLPKHLLRQFYWSLKGSLIQQAGQICM